MKERMLVRELTELCRQVHDNERFGYLVKQRLELYMNEGNEVTEGTALHNEGTVLHDKYDQLEVKYDNGVVEYPSDVLLYM